MSLVAANKKDAQDIITNFHTHRNANLVDNLLALKLEDYSKYFDLDPIRRELLILLQHFQKNGGLQGLSKEFNDACCKLRIRFVEEIAAKIVHPGQSAHERAYSDAISRLPWGPCWRLVLAYMLPGPLPIAPSSLTRLKQLLRLLLKLGLSKGLRDAIRLSLLFAADSWTPLLPQRRDLFLDLQNTGNVSQLGAVAAMNILTGIGGLRSTAPARLKAKLRERVEEFPQNWQLNHDGTPTPANDLTVLNLEILARVLAMEQARPQSAHELAYNNAISLLPSDTMLPRRVWLGVFENLIPGPLPIEPNSLTRLKQQLRDLLKLTVSKSFRDAIRLSLLFAGDSWPVVVPLRPELFQVLQSTGQVSARDAAAAMSVLMGIAGRRGTAPARLKATLWNLVCRFPEHWQLIDGSPKPVNDSTVVVSLDFVARLLAMEQARP